MIVGITISNSQVYLLGFSLWKALLTLMGNKSIYSVGKEFGKANKLFAKQRVSRVLRKMALLAKHLRTSQPGLTF